jgi:outer membrane protein OmpA-like peptidoglycan-associated protein
MKWAAGIALLLLMGGCATVENARARLVRPPATCADQTVSIYFEADSAELTREGRMLIAQAASATAGCRVASVDVLGLADAVGTPAANLELSKKRAEAVAQALSANGLPAAEFRVGAAGDAGALTAKGQTRPLRRRVDVTVHLAGRS